MADFDELDWRERFSANGDAPRSIHELAKSVFTFDHGDAQVLVQPIDSQSGWWKQMQSDDLHPAPTRDEVSPHQVGPSQAPFHDHKNSSFGDFQEMQRQSTPPIESPRAERRTEANKALRQVELKWNSGHGDTTTDDSEKDETLDEKAQKLSKTKPYPGRQSKSPESSSGAESPPSNESTHHAIGKHPSTGPVCHPSVIAPATEATGTGELQKPPSKELGYKASSDSHIITRPKRKLGKIGSRHGKPAPTPDDEDFPAKRSVITDAGTNGPVASPLKKPKHKLGRIGGKVKANEPSDKTGEVQIRDSSNPPDERKQPLKEDIDVSEDLIRTKPTSPKAGVPFSRADQRPVGKISDMQANENRERLKRELEAKSINTNKKKRKF